MPIFITFSPDEGHSSRMDKGRNMMLKGVYREKMKKNRNDREMEDLLPPPVDNSFVPAYASLTGVQDFLDQASKKRKNVAKSSFLDTGEDLHLDVSRHTPVQRSKSPNNLLVTPHTNPAVAAATKVPKTAMTHKSKSFSS